MTTQDVKIEPITDVNLNPAEVQAAMANEIGILSGDLLVTKMKLGTSLAHVNHLAMENANLRMRIIQQDADIKSMRDQLAGPNHPVKRKRS